MIRISEARHKANAGDPPARQRGGFNASAKKYRVDFLSRVEEVPRKQVGFGLPESQAEARINIVIAGHVKTVRYIGSSLTHILVSEREGGRDFNTGNGGWIPFVTHGCSAAERGDIGDAVAQCSAGSGLCAANFAFGPLQAARDRPARTQRQVALQLQPEAACVEIDRHELEAHEIEHEELLIGHVVVKARQVNMAASTKETRLQASFVSPGGGLSIGLAGYTERPAQREARKTAALGTASDRGIKVYVIAGFEIERGATSGTGTAYRRCAVRQGRQH